MLEHYKCEIFSKSCVHAKTLTNESRCYHSWQAVFQFVSLAYNLSPRDIISVSYMEYYHASSTYRC